VCEFVGDRGIDVEKLFTHRWGLEQAEEAYSSSTPRRRARLSFCVLNVADRRSQHTLLFLDPGTSTPR